ncbi:MAG: amidohydrolase [Gemmatimonadaceae bacterium]|jgi:predicted TIM-barrel fold metal-dependent hydrolase|nr:amidohydrolase [Gemmatimonadaceae bacterium]
MLRVRPFAVLTGVCVLSLSLAAQPPAGRGPVQDNRGTPIKDGEACPPGMTEVRPRNCQAPTMPAPSILDYRPRSTLVTTEHLVPRAKFPAIDFHGHPTSQLSSAEALERLGDDLDRIGVRVIVAANNVTGNTLKQQLALVAASPRMKDRVRILTGIDFRGIGPGWAEKAIAQLEADVAAGAVGVGEIGKGLGLSTRKADGTRLRIDDPELDPVWAACARLKLPVFIHTADPQEFWQPIDNNNERWLELALFPGRRYPAEQYPTFEQLIAERDAMLKRNPKTTFVIAHLGWHANDLPRLAKLLDAAPNVHAEVGAVLYDIARQPRAAHDFFIKYQDRLLFGKDSFQPEEYPYYWRVFETRDDYFDYYRPYHAFWKLYGIDLPDGVLKKVYFGNALRITGGLPKDGWPK